MEQNLPGVGVLGSASCSYSSVIGTDILAGWSCATTLAFALAALQLAVVFSYTKSDVDVDDAVDEDEDDDDGIGVVSLRRFFFIFIQASFQLWRFLPLYYYYDDAFLFICSWRLFFRMTGSL